MCGPFGFPALSSVFGEAQPLNSGPKLPLRCILWWWKMRCPAPLGSHKKVYRSELGSFEIKWFQFVPNIIPYFPKWPKIRGSMASLFGIRIELSKWLLRALQCSHQWHCLNLFIPVGGWFVFQIVSLHSSDMGKKSRNDPPIQDIQLSFRIMPVVAQPGLFFQCKKQQLPEICRVGESPSVGVGSHLVALLGAISMITGEISRVLISFLCDVCAVLKFHVGAKCHGCECHIVSMWESNMHHLSAIRTSTSY